MSNPDVWPLCTAHRDCDHGITHASTEVGDLFARAHMADYVNGNGYAVCPCHPNSATEAARLGVTPFPCDESERPTQ